MVLANSDKKVLLIDADMRKGLLHKRLEVKRDKGLSDLILNSIEPAEAIKTINEVGFDFISTGALPPNPSELLLHQNFEKLLIELNDQYDLIIIDSSPILAVTDASIIGRLVGATLMVVKAGEHSITELELSVKKFKQNDVNIKGIVLNDLTINSSSYGYNYAYEKYSYERTNTE
jgi:tyrosine-protein kinase Etk/Wzc